HTTTPPHHASNLSLRDALPISTDGKMFDRSVARGKPSTFGVNRVIAGFSEGIQLMVPGETRRLWIPEATGFARDHQLDPFAEAGDHAIDAEGRRLAARDRAVEHFSVGRDRKSVA